MKWTALDRPRDFKAEMAGEKDGKAGEAAFGLDWLDRDTLIPHNRCHGKIAHGGPACSSKRPAIRMPRSKVHFHQSGFDRLKRKPKTQSTRNKNTKSKPTEIERPREGQARSYFTSTVAPASTNFFWIAAASSLLTPSLIGLGAPSTRSLASFSPKLVTSRTALITLILFAPTAVRMTLNSVFSSTAGAAAAAGPAAIAIGAAAAADTPNFSSSNFTSWEASSSVRP